MKFKIEGVTGEEFASRLFYVAWQRCGGPLGMGMLQDRGPGMTEEQVVANVKCDGDYPRRLLSLEARVLVRRLRLWAHDEDGGRV